MGLYSRLILPRLCDFALARPLVAQHRRALLAGVGGDVLEVGFGTGLNLPHYPSHVRSLTAVDPNPGMHRGARRRLEQTGIAVRRIIADAAALPFGPDRFDAVVTTFTLCSIDDVERALSEIHRVLRPGGLYAFLEHGLSPETGVRRWQRRLNGLQQRFGGGCRLDRNIGELVARQPFASVEIDEFYLDRTLRTHGSMYRGRARK